jgi:hypothetical protein
MPEKPSIAHAPELGKDARGAIWIGDELDGGSFGRPSHRGLTQDKIADGLIIRLQKVRAISHRPTPFNVERNSRGIRWHGREMEEPIWDVKIVQGRKVLNTIGGFTGPKMDVDVLIANSDRPEKAPWPRINPKVEVVNLGRKIGGQLTSVEV